MTLDEVIRRLIAKLEAKKNLLNQPAIDVVIESLAEVQAEIEEEDGS